ncbi:MAG: helix-turn-helix domain-containing protein [Lachnospiraceae bacterium]|jgi:transcriptional regulator with XRE-family HTH domain|nr:helix-turn-helix domain-containing protein [Lachnospiraceae bacterium]
MEDKIAFGQFIRKKRKVSNLTQREFAEKLYVTESAVSKWERGLSYPDITIVRPICTILGISEHELIIASDDKLQHQIERQAKTLQNMQNTWKWFWYILYGAGLLTCLIVNLAIEHTLSWFFLVLTSIAVAFTLTSLPHLLNKYKSIITLVSFFITLVILLLVSNIYVGGNFWFITAFASILFGFAVVFLPFVLKGVPLPQPIARHKSLICIGVDTILLLNMLIVIFIQQGKVGILINKAMPITIVCLPVAWITLVIWRYIKADALVRTGLTLILASGYIYLINEVVYTILYKIPFRLPALSTSFISSPHTANVFIVSVPLILGLISLCIEAFIKSRNK